MNTKEFHANRARYSLSELLKYRGQWVAFTSDGRRIIACSDSLERLDELVIAAGEDPQQSAFERIEFDEVYLGSAERDG